MRLSVSAVGGWLVVNLAILGYLVWTKRLFGVRGGQAGLDRELAADVDWPGIHAHAPVMHDFAAEPPDDTIHKA